jgi:elongation factor G
MSVAIAPRREEDRAQLLAALKVEAGHDTTFQFDAELNALHVMLYGSEELHLDALIEQINTRHGLTVEVGTPGIGYLESPTRTVTVDYTHKRIHHGNGEFARLLIEMAPVDEPECRMEIRCPASDLPEVFHDGLKKGFETVLQSGPMAGFPVVGVAIAVTGAAFHETDSTPLKFEIAARAALRQALEQGHTRLFEPIMNVSVMAPEKFCGAVITDLHARLAEINHTAIAGGLAVLRAYVPLATLFGHLNALRSKTTGLGTSTVVYSHHAAVPDHQPDEGPENFPPAIGMRA